VIFANGILHDDVYTLHTVIHSHDVIIAADGGARHCRALGIAPTVVIGDFDSLTDEELAALEAAGTQVIRHPARKDSTDLELALQHAVSLGADEILVLGALGARWDQTLTNFLLPAAPGLERARIRLLDGSQEISLLRGGNSLELMGRPGDTVSLIPLGGNARDITTAGLEYPLERGTLHFGATRGVSNVLLGKQATVSLEEGLLLCIVIHNS
jgi:thiamine pyrophosphokinase